MSLHGCDWLQRRQLQQENKFRKTYETNFTGASDKAEQVRSRSYLTPFQGRDSAQRRGFDVTCRHCLLSGSPFQILPSCKY